MAARLISISSESPHRITNGYNLRVHKLLVNAAHRADIEVHCFAPVTAASLDAAKTWANSTNVQFHGVLLEREMQYDQTMRAAFKKECCSLLASYSADSIYLLHGLVPIIDFADQEFAHYAIADMVDEIGPLMKKNVMRQLKSGRFKEFLRAAKALWLYRVKIPTLLANYKHIAVVAHDDAFRLRKFLPRKSVKVIPNGVDFPADLCRTPSTEQPVVLFHGVYGYEPNEEAALFLINNVAPLLKKRLPHCKVVLAGRNPTTRMLEAESVTANVEIVGEIDCLSSYLLSASVGAYPIFTRTGLQNKILEAFSHGLPIVTTPGIMSVFDAFSKDVRDCARTAISTNDFVQQIGELLGNADLCQQLSTRSRDFVKKHFEWQGVVQQLIQLQ